MAWPLAGNSGPSLIVDNATAHRGQRPGVLEIEAACRVWVGAATACQGWLYHGIRVSVNLTQNNKIIKKMINHSN